MTNRMRETPEIVARDYVLARRRNDVTFYESPVKYALADVARRDPALKKELLERTQKYKQKHRELLERGQTYEPMFPWKDRELYADDIFDLFREGVKRREGLYTMADMTQEEAVNEMKVYRDKLKARVKSKSPHGGTTPTYYHPSITGIWLDSYGRPVVRDTTCNCDDHGWDNVKGLVTKTTCLHLAEMNQDFYERINYTAGERPVDGFEQRNGRQLFMPFTFASNWRLTAAGKWEPESGHRAALEGDLAVYRYIYNKGYFELNRTLLTNPLHHIYADSTTDELANRRLTREVIRQDLKKRKISRNEAGEAKLLFDKVEKTFKTMRFRQTGYCLELGNPAYHYENHGGEAVRLFYQDGNLLYSWRNRPVGGQKPDIRAVDTGENDAFRQIGVPQFRFDDRTMMHTAFKVDTVENIMIQGMNQPLKTPIPEVLVRKYRKATR